MAREAPSASKREITGYRQRLRELVSQMRAQGVPAGRIAAELKEIAEGIK